MTNHARSVMQEIVDNRLEGWGKWVRSGGELLGYSHLSNIGKLQKYGIIPWSSGAKPRELDNPDAEEIEILILELKSFYPVEAQAIIDYYSTSLDKFSIVAHFYKNEISVRTFEQRIKSGKLWLEGRLKLYEKISNESESEENV